MTEVTRVFDVARGRFLNVQRKYCGQQYDSLSTTLHFEYDPIDFLKDTGFIPYIMFDVQDCDGCPLIYGPNSDPVFDGYTFSIPWDVTSRIKSQRVEYQLYFVSSKDYVFDEQTRRYKRISKGTKYVISPKDGIALKPTIGNKRKCCPPTMSPSTEPDVVGYINLWKEEGLIGPVTTSVDPVTGKYTLMFQTFNGKRYDVELEVEGGGGVGYIQNDILVDTTVGHLTSGTLLRAGTSYEDIFRMMLTSEEPPPVPPTTDLLLVYGSSTGVPYSHEALNNRVHVDDATVEMLTDDAGWHVRIITGIPGEGGDVPQYAVVAVSKTLRLTSWASAALPTYNYCDYDMVGVIDPHDPEPTPGPGPTRYYRLSGIDSSHDISAIFGPRTTVGYTYTFHNVTDDASISTSFVPSSSGDADYVLYYLKDPPTCDYDLVPPGTEYILKFEEVNR